MEMRLIRVFPRRTQATPMDDYVRIGSPCLFDEADAIHISVTFTWDIREAEKLERQWKHVAPTTIGGPAIGQKGEDFVPGKYIKDGYVITSRGCPNRCWFCSVWRRDGNIRELPIHDGWNVLDDNLLACSDEHIRNVFAMLARQNNRPVFTGGLEAARLKMWHAVKIREVKSKTVFFAYDTPDDLEPLQEAMRIMKEAGFTEASHSLRCYVLCGYKSDTMIAAENRMRQAMVIGFTPMAMLYRGKNGELDKGWRQFQRVWARPAIIWSKMRSREGAGGVPEDSDREDMEVT